MWTSKCRRWALHVDLISFIRWSRTSFTEAELARTSSSSWNVTKTGWVIKTKMFHGDKSIWTSFPVGFPVYFLCAHERKGKRESCHTPSFGLELSGSSSRRCRVKSSSWEEASTLHLLWLRPPPQRPGYDPEDSSIYEGNPTVPNLRNLLMIARFWFEN